MNKFKKKVYHVLLSVIVFSSITHSSMPTIGADLGFKSKYVWRGIAFNDDKVFWPDMWINWNGFTVTGFLSMDMTDRNTTLYGRNYQSEVTDIDILLDYTKSFGKMNFSAGYNQFIFPGYSELFNPLSEPYLKIGLNAFIQPSVTMYVDITKDKADNDNTAVGFYVSPKLSRTFAVGCANSTIAVSTGFGTEKFNKIYAYHKKSTITDITFSLSTIVTPPAPLSDHATMTLDVNYALTPDKKLQEALLDDAHFWAGLTVNLFHTFSKKE